jgi:DNA mismatch endonuclease, patch repair protein
MADVHSKETRSFNMSQIKGKDTKWELIVRRYLFKNGFRFRIHDNKLPGKPDIVLKRYKTIIMINGCFWHMHEGCKDFIIPKTNTKKWMEKLKGNKIRDIKNYERLGNLKWKIITIWECDLKSNNRENLLQSIIQEIRNI